MNQESPSEPPPADEPSSVEIPSCNDNVINEELFDCTGSLAVHSSGSLANVQSDRNEDILQGADNTESTVRRAEQVLVEESPAPRPGYYQLYSYNLAYWKNV